MWSQHGCTRILSTYELRQPGVLERYMAMGYRYIKQRHYTDYNRILRAPTTGCMVEIRMYPGFFFVPIASRAGWKILTKMSYF